MYRRVTIGIVLIPLFLICSFLIISAVGWILSNFLEPSSVLLTKIIAWVIIIFLLMYSTADWFLDKTILKEDHVLNIHWKGLFKVEKAIIEYPNIQKISIKANFLQKFFNIGNVHIYDAGTKVIILKDLFLANQFVEHVKAKTNG